MKENKTIIKGKCYIPHEYRSHPFYFINLPYHLLLVTMMYWLALCPISYSLIIRYDFEHTSIVFFIMCINIYIAIVLIFVAIWRCKNRRNKQTRYEIAEKPSKDKICSEVSSDIDIKQQDYSNTRRYSMTQEQFHKSGNPSTPLILKPISYQDIIEAVQNVDGASCYSCDKPGPTSNIQENEYFIALVDVKKTCKSEAFFVIQDAPLLYPKVECIVDCTK